MYIIVSNQNFRKARKKGRCSDGGLCRHEIRPEVYVEPSRRPTDGRYGENPNRLQSFYQFQVILKPGPENVQELYLESLAHLGIMPGKHDIRFVEDD